MSKTIKGKVVILEADLENNRALVTIEVPLDHVAGIKMCQECTLSTIDDKPETALDPGEFVIKGSDLHRKNRAWLVGGIGSNDPIRKPKPKYLTRKPIPADGYRIWVSWPDVETDYRVWLLLNASEIAESWEKHQHTIRWMHEWSMPSIKKEQQ